MSKLTDWRPTRSGLLLTVVIVVLAAAVLSGLWIVKERGESARREAAIEVAQEQLEAENDGVVALNEGDEAASESSSEATTNGETVVVEEDMTTTATVTELPQTGPSALGLMIAGIMGVLTYGAVLSVGSRRRAKAE